MVKFSKTSLDSFLNSALNIEYVYCILLGINTHFEQLQNDCRIVIHSNDKISKIVFQNIKVKDQSRWNVGHLETESQFNMFTRRSAQTIDEEFEMNEI